MTDMVDDIINRQELRVALHKALRETGIDNTDAKRLIDYQINIVMADMLKAICKTVPSSMFCPGLK